MQDISGSCMTVYHRVAYTLDSNVQVSKIDTIELVVADHQPFLQQNLRKNGEGSGHKKPPFGGGSGCSMARSPRWC